MKPRNTLTLLALLVAVAIGTVWGTAGQRQVGGFVAQMPPQTAAPMQPSQVGHRHITRKTGVAITSRLEPGDEVVEVIDNGDPPFVSFDDPVQAAQFGPAVAVIEVTKKESAFSATTVPSSEFYSNEDWITTTLTAEVRSVLKDTTGQLVERGLIEIRESGGEVVLGDGLRIIARYKLTRQTKVGGIYLAALGFHEGRFSFDRFGSVEFDQGQVKHMRLDVSPGLSNQSPESVIQQVRESAKQRKP